jgi:hypothetical protein
LNATRLRQFQPKTWVAAQTIMAFWLQAQKFSKKPMMKIADFA